MVHSDVQPGDFLSGCFWRSWQPHQQVMEGRISRMSGPMMLAFPGAAFGWRRFPARAVKAMTCRHWTLEKGRAAVVSSAPATGVMQRSARISL